MVFLILTLQFVICIFHGYEGGNSSPNYHCQDIVTFLKTNKNLTNQTKKKPPPPKKPIRNSNTSGNVPFPAIFESNLIFCCAVLLQN